MSRRHATCSCTSTGNSCRSETIDVTTCKLHCDHVCVRSGSQGLGAACSIAGRFILNQPGKHRPVCVVLLKLISATSSGARKLLQLLDEWLAVVVRGAATRWAARLRGQFAGVSLVAVSASTAAEIVRKTCTDAYCYRAAGAMGLLATLGGGDGSALIAEAALLGIPLILSEVHTRRRLGTPYIDRTTVARPETAMVVDEDVDESHENICLLSQQVIEVLRAYPSVLDQLMIRMEEQCALETTPDQGVVDHLQSMRIFRDAHLLRVSDDGDAHQVERVARALRIAAQAKERGGRVTQAAAELAALLTVSQAKRN